MIFASDGEPNCPSGIGCIGSFCQGDLDLAIIEAGITKSYPIRILAIGVGDPGGLSGGFNVDSLGAIFISN